MSKKEENKNRNVAWTVSIGLHILLLIVFIFMIAWREPNPPYPEFGIEVNFGTSTVGNGELQPEQPANKLENLEDAKPEEQAVEEVAEELVEEVPEVTENNTVAEDTEVVTQPTENPDVVEEEVVQEINQPEEIVEEVKEKEQEVEQEPEEKKSPIVYENKEGADGKTGESDSPQNANHGDDTEEVGDKGNEEGDIDARTLYGNKGGGDGGFDLQISGWHWDDLPDKKDTSNENGEIKFSFVVDDEGYVGNIQVIKSTVSPGVATFYKEQLRNTTFSQDNPNIAPLPQTRGTVTFIIKSR